MDCQRIDQHPITPHDLRAIVRPLLWPITIVAAVVLVYANSLSTPFIFDDIRYIVKDNKIRQLWPLWDLLTGSTRPVHYLLLAINYQVGGLNPWNYHVTSVVVHALAALALFGLTRRTLQLQTGPLSEDRFSGPIAFTIALAWAVHPLQTQAVTCTWQRAEALMGLFYLLTLYCFARTYGSPRSAMWQAAAVICCLLGMACKEVMVTAPLVVLLYDRLFLCGSWKALLHQHWRAYAGFCFAWALLGGLLLTSATTFHNHPGVGFASTTFSSWDYLLTMPGALVHYLRLSFWPHPLLLDYRWPSATSPGDIVPQLLLVTVLLALSLWALRRHWGWGFLGAWFFLILGPTSSFMPMPDPVVEHRLYLPLAAVLAGGVLGWFLLCRRLATAIAIPLRIRPWLYPVPLSLAVILLALLTMQRNQLYHSPEAVWHHTIRHGPENGRAHFALALSLTRRHQYDQAWHHLEKALEHDVTPAMVYRNMAVIRLRQNQQAQALPLLQKSQALGPDNAWTNQKLGTMLLQLERYKEALPLLRKAAQAGPEDAALLYNLGYAYERTGSLRSAEKAFRKALRIAPRDGETLCHLGNVLARQGADREAVECYRKSLAVKPDYTAALCCLALVLERAGHLKESDERHRQAIERVPADANLRYTHGRVLLRLGKRTRAIKRFEEALQRNPAHQGAKHALKEQSGSD